ncbi:hypothetical protein IJG79_00120 [Candidatus Saccharibacteria bacterium]|nr:hypothetical protein [Candidatus Saccharibacteria bacterium]
MLNKKEKNITRGLVAIFALVFAYTTISLLAPLQKTSAYWITDAPQQVNVYLRPSIGISVLDSTATSDITDLSINITPTSTGTFNKNSAVAHVYTTNPTGYTLYLSSDYQNHAGANTSSLINTNTSVDDTTATSIGNVPTLASSNVAESTFSAANSAHKNRWGFSRSWNETVAGNTYSGGSATAYYPVPVKGTQTVVRSDVTRQISSSNTTIGVGVNIDTTKAAGTYRNRLVLTAIANAE